MFNRSKRTRTIDPPPPVNPITGRPYGERPPVRDEEAERRAADGQLALANARRPAPTSAPFRANDGWRGARG